MGSTKGMIGALAALALLAACAKQPSATTESAATESPEALAERAEMAQREADIQKREAELADREAAAAAAEAEAARAAAAKPVAKPAKPAVATPVVSKPSTPPPPPAPKVVTVPAGTQLPLALTADLTSRTAKVGDPVRASLTSDVRVGDRVAIPAGTTVAGQITGVVSGSDKIGGVPSLAMQFDRIELAGNKDVPINGEIVQKGKSDTGRDTAKIVGGTAAGAIIGHQVKGGDKGKVIGGLIGGAIGAVAAHETGTEAKIAAGAPLTISLTNAVDITL
jgi:hypothetical protein